MITFYAILLVAGSQDIVASEMNTTIYPVTWTLRIGVIVVPFLGSAGSSGKLLRDLKHSHEQPEEPDPPEAPNRFRRRSSVADRTGTRAARRDGARPRRCARVYVASHRGSGWIIALAVETSRAAELVGCSARWSRSCATSAVAAPIAPGTVDVSPAVFVGRVERVGGKREVSLAVPRRTPDRRSMTEAAATTLCSASDAPFDDVHAAVYTVPTDEPESDGTLEWDSTTIVVVEVDVGGVRGIGYTFGLPRSRRIVNGTLADTLRGRAELTPACAGRRCRPRCATVVVPGRR